jgi:hypothetical protein
MLVSPATGDPAKQQRIDSCRREGARFRDDSKLGVLGGPAEVADRLRAAWEDPVLLAVLDDPTLDEERHQRVVRKGRRVRFGRWQSSHDTSTAVRCGSSKDRNPR